VATVPLTCFCLGLSTRKAAQVLAPVLGEKVSASTISRIARDLDHEVSRYHGRTLEDKYQYLFFDGVVLRSKGAVKVQKKILLCAFGVTVEGRHEMIDFYPAASESGRAGKRFYAICIKGGLREALVS
jgi:putative transposase